MKFDTRKLRRLILKELAEKDRAEIIRAQIDEAEKNLDVLYEQLRKAEDSKFFMTESGNCIHAFIDSIRAEYEETKPKDNQP